MTMARMSTTPGTRSSPDVVSSPQEPRRAFRSSRDNVLGGVGAGLADHLGVAVVWVRLFFVATAVFGFGLVLYAALWIMLPLEVSTAPQAPGLEAASRRGMRPSGRPQVVDTGILVALAALGIGLAALLDLTLGGVAFLWPAVVGVVGVALLWRQADQAQRERWVDTTGRLGVGRILLGRGGLAAYARVLTGLGLLVVALAIFAAQSGRLGEARAILLAGILGMAGLAVVLGPWLYRLAGEVTAERAERVRTQERADVAAHLHDSVLQTLALIQSNAQDPGRVAQLARAQERDLRAWLYGGSDSSAETVAGALAAAAAEIEDTHGVPVHVVSVGDTALSTASEALVAATREALANAARHSGAAKVDLYCEVAGGAVEVYVRDRGCGFDPASVPVDRLGVRGSIVERMARHGGEAELRTGAGEGTEVRLRLPAPAQPASPGDGDVSERRMQA